MKKSSDFNLKLDEKKIYEAIYWAIRDLFETSLEEASIRLREQNPNASKSTVFLTLIYEAIKEGVYRAFKEYLSSLPPSVELLRELIESKGKSSIKFK